MTEWATGIVDDAAPVGDRDLRFDRPPVGGARERRAHARAYRYWDTLRAGRRLPAIGDIDPRALTGFAANSIVFELQDDAVEPAIHFIGRALADEAGGAADGTGTTMARPGTLLGELGCRLPLIAATGAPLDFEAEYVGQAAMPTLYRGILLPFAATDGRPAFIYGVVTWKTIATALDDDICSAVGSALSLPAAATVESPWQTGRPATAALPPASAAQRLAAAQTWAALASTDHANRASSLHAALSAAHDLLLAQATVAQHGPDEPGTVIDAVFGPAVDRDLRQRYVAVLAHARRLRLGAGTLAAMLDRYEDGVTGYLATSVPYHPSLSRPRLSLHAVEQAPGPSSAADHASPATRVRRAG